VNSWAVNNSMEWIGAVEIKLQEAVVAARWGFEL